MRAILTNSRERTLARRKELLSNVAVGDVHLKDKLSEGGDQRWGRGAGRGGGKLGPANLFDRG